MLTPTESTTTLHQVLASTKELFQRHVDALATACSREGRLDNALLDRHQFSSYELAIASADLLAAETVLQSAVSPQDQGLARAFATQAVLDVTGRLETISIELGLDLDDLQALLTGSELTRLRQATLTGRVLADLGRGVSQVNGDVGRVELEESLAMAQDAFRRFGADIVTPQAEQIHRKDLTVPESLLQPMREMGVFGLSIPESYGGSAVEGQDETLMMLTVTEALSEASLAAAGSLITRPEILARALMAGGTDAQRQRWLPAIASGHPLCGIAITEPDAGSDVAALTLRASKVDGGWLLDGAKTWCTFAGKAGLLMVVARTNPDRKLGHKGLSVFLVEKPSYDGHDFAFQQERGGRLTGRAIPTIGYRGMHSFDLAFESFFVPDDAVIGEQAGIGRGFYFTMAGMVGGRMQTAGRACGVMRAALKAAVLYAQDRRVFGSPLIEFPLTQVKLATMAARLAACRHLAYAVGRRLDTPSGRVEASLVKLLACRSAEVVTREALQIHGGMGYAEETPVSRYYVDARVLSIFEGAEETLALKVVARGMLEAALGKAAGAA